MELAMTKIAFIFIGTSKYKRFFEGYYIGLNTNFVPGSEKTFFVFTDEPSDVTFDRPNVVTTTIEHQGWPWITLNRFKFIQLVRDRLLEFDHVFFVDADLWAVNPIEEAEVITDKPLIGVQHPGFVGVIGTFETDPRSKANIFDGKYDLTKYRQGCFWGGRSQEFVEMVDVLASWVESDLKNGIVAVWHDESHTNKYFLLHPDKVNTLHPGFAQPQMDYEHIRQNFPTKFVHLYKEMNEFPRFSGVK
jgi:hypothetical protein